MAKKKDAMVREVRGGWIVMPDGSKMRKGKFLDMMRAANLAPPTNSGRTRFLQTAGLQYGGRRDIYKVAGYIDQGAEDFDNYWALYDRDPIAGRIVDMPAKTTWRTPPEVVEGDGQDDEHEVGSTQFEADWLKLVKRLKVWRHFEKADRLARIGRYSVLLIGTRGTEDAAMREEMEPLHSLDDILYLQSYAEKYATIQQWETSNESARFGLPLLYEIHLSGGESTGFKPAGTGRLLVHWSRVLHVAEDPLLDEVYGRPALKRCLNALFDSLKVSAATGEAYWQLAARVLAASVDANAELPEGMLDAMGEALEDITHDLRRHFAGQGVDLGWLQSTTPEPGSAMDMLQGLFSIGSGIPKRVLFGSERGELASSQDERNYFGMINEREEHHAEPNILRAFIDRMIERKGFKISPDAEYTIVWPSMFELTEKEIAEANLLRAKSAKELTSMGGDPLDLVEIDQDRNVWLIPRSAEDAAAEKAAREEQQAIEDARRAEEMRQRAEALAQGKPQVDAEGNPIQQPPQPPPPPPTPPK